ncbi:MAG: McrC family protein [Gammaproteobacteria bacterium]|nr:McrC family protein [Gammaproteobacteria bacterium]
MRNFAASIREWQHLPIGPNDLSIGAADRLHALAERETNRLRVPQPVLTRTAKPSPRAGQVVGVLSVPAASVEILPKIGGEDDGSARHALTRMLAVAWGLPVADSEPALLATQSDDLLEVLIRLFADRLLVAVRRGLPQRYRLQEDDLPLLRGKLNVPRQLARYAIRTDRLACSFDELSVDTPLNRVLKAAVVRLAATTRSPANSRRLAELVARFEFVGESADPFAEPVRLDRTNTAFHRLHRMARQLLGGDWQSTTTGAVEGYALLFPMNELFEEFVGLTLGAALSPQPVYLQHTGRYALEGQHRALFALRPDIVVNDGLVIDTKWKELKPSEPTLGVEQADVYQMLAYARAYEATRLVLLYPWHQGLDRPGILQRWRIAGTSTLFDIATVDVGEPDSVRLTLREIAGMDGRTTPTDGSARGFPMDVATR